MATEVQKYLTCDGKIFDNKLEAEGHEMSLQTKKVVEEFIAAAGYKKVQAGMARKMVPAFLAFQAAHAGA